MTSSYEHSDVAPDNGEFYTVLPGCGLAWRMRISPRLFGLLDKPARGGRRYRRFYGVIIGNFQCGFFSWKVEQWPDEVEDKLDDQ